MNEQQQQQQQPPPVILQPAPPTLGQRIKRFFAPVLAALAAIAKVCWPFIKVALPALKSGGLILVNIWVYARFYGWPFAVGFVALIFIHEMGHLIAAKIMGLKVSLPYFIPFMGAVIMLKEAPRNAWVESFIGVGGPLLGSIGALAVGCGFFYTGNPIFLVLCYYGFLINLFNLIPIVPLDGGRIVTALSPWLWLVGVVIFGARMAYSFAQGNLIFNFTTCLIIGIVVLSLPRLLALFRPRTPEQQRYFECAPWQRLVMAVLYFGLAGGLYLGMEFLGKIVHLG